MELCLIKTGSRSPKFCFVFTNFVNNSFAMVDGKRYKSWVSGMPYAASALYSGYKRYFKKPNRYSGASPKRRRLSGPRTRTKSRAGRSFTMMRRKKSRRSYALRRRRRRTYRNFARKINRLQYPPEKYRKVTFDRIVQGYNEQALVPSSSWMVSATLNDIGDDLAISTSTSGPDPPRWYLGKYGVDLELVNSSPSVTYVQVYWCLASRDQNLSPATLIANDTAAFTNLDHTLVMTALTTRFSDLRQFKQNYRVLKKQYIVMEPGAVAKSHVRRRGKSINSDYINYDTFTYLKGLSLVPVFRVWSQIVKNRDNDNFVVDNTTLGIKHTQWATYGFTPKKYYQAPRTIVSVNPTATPITWTEATQQNS